MFSVRCPWRLGLGTRNYGSGTFFWAAKMLYCQGEDLETRDFNVIWIGYQKVTWRRWWPTWNVIGFNNRIGTWEIERSLRCKRMRRRRRTRRRRGGPSLWLTWIFPRLHRHSCRPEGMQRPHHLQHHHHYRQRGFATAASSPSQLQKKYFLLRPNDTYKD